MLQPIILSGRVQEETSDGSIGSSTGRGAGRSVVFFVQPNISESGSTSYAEIEGIRQAANIMIYMGSPSRTFSIEATFVSRSVQEAEATLGYVNTLRSWRMPEQSPGSGVKAPARIFLTGLNGQFKQISVRMMDLNITLNEDVDYIVVPEQGAVPIVWNVSMTLKEARSIQELGMFNIQQFRQGTLDGW